ncbi:MAG: response regulator transcription factor [Sulfurimonas sp.]|jgi:DNA-binding response OmpR family regulator|nr:response regulator transcription factor [Sulfurimonas sp.]
METLNIDRDKYKINKLKNYTKSMSILMVEDYEPLHQSLKKILTSLFLNVDAAFDGEEALSLYRDKLKSSENYDIVLSDIAMPNMNGMELSKAIKNINPTQNIVILSAHKDANYLLEFLNLGIRRFIPKPVDFNFLLDELSLVCLAIYKENELSNIIKLSESIYFNTKEKTLYEDKKEIILNSSEKLILEVLILALNQSVSNDEIVNYLYLFSKDVSLDNVRKLVYKLRQKLPHELIQNVHGIGYRIVQQF